MGDRRDLHEFSLNLASGRKLHIYLQACRYICSMEKKIINTTQAPAPIGPYNQAVQAGNLLFISGQVAINPATGNIEAADIYDETHLVMHNLKAILSEAGMDFSNVAKTTIFLSDMSLFTTVNEVYGKYFTGSFPARETVAVKGLPKNVNVEISMIAVL
jgi:2-iminobutanoate/2-iminopropanoate deaminase